MPQWDVNHLTTSDNTTYGDGNFDLSGFNYLDPSNVSGPSQAYTGVDVMGGFNSHPDYPTPFTAPMSLADELYPGEGKWYRTSRWVAFGKVSPSTPQHTAPNSTRG